MTRSQMWKIRGELFCQATVGVVDHGLFTGDGVTLLLLLLLLLWLWLWLWLWGGGAKDQLKKPAF